jgi:hypothetical protein
MASRNCKMEMSRASMQVCERAPILCRKILILVTLASWIRIGVDLQNLKRTLHHSPLRTYGLIDVENMPAIGIYFPQYEPRRRRGEGEAVEPMKSSELGRPPHRAVTSDGATIELRVPGGNRPCSRRRIGAITLTAGLVSWIACEWACDLFRPRLLEVPRWEAVWMEPTPESRYAADLKNAALANAVLGCAAGFAMGLAGGLAARAPSRGIFVGLSAQAVGLLVGALSALAVIPVFHPVFPRMFRTVTNDMWLPLVMHAGIWAAVGAVSGAAFAIGMGCKSRLLNAIGSATAGALLAAVFFQLIGTCLPLGAGATRPVARWSVVRLVAMLLPVSMIAVGAVLGTVGHVRPSDPNH